MNNLLYFRKRHTQAQAHYDLSARHRVDETPDFNRFLWKWLVGLAIVLFLVGAAIACEPVESETIKIRVVNL